MSNLSSNDFPSFKTSAEKVLSSSVSSLEDSSSVAYDSSPLSLPYCSEEPLYSSMRTLARPLISQLVLRNY